MNGRGSETFYKDGDQIELTQSALVLENLISKFPGELRRSKGKTPGEEPK